MASCVSSTLETKSKINVLMKNNIICLKSGSFKELIPIVIIFKAMGMESDKDIMDFLNPFLNETEFTQHYQTFENFMYLSFQPMIKNSLVT